jgi:translocation and assembly module TamA
VRASLSVAPTSAHGQTTRTFYITQFTIAEYLDLSHLFHAETGRSVLALRALLASAFGATETVTTVDGVPGVTIPNLPPDQRFYAGGSGTVRGYRYQSVGPEFPDGTPIGGTALTAVNVEFRQRIGTSFGAALFVDAGKVGEQLNPVHGARCSASTPSHSTTDCWAVGVGGGVRYYTPIGVLRLDLAVPTVRRPNDDRFEVYIGLGQAF